MRKNISDLKTSVDFEELPQDETFSKLWDDEHPDVAIAQRDANDEEIEYEVCNDPTFTSISTTTNSIKSTPQTTTTSTFDSDRQYIVLNQKTQGINMAQGKRWQKKQVIWVMESQARQVKEIGIHSPQKRN